MTDDLRHGGVDLFDNRGADEALQHRDVFGVAAMPSVPITTLT